MNRLVLRPGKAGDQEWIWKTKKRCLRRYVEQSFGAWDEASQHQHFVATYVPEEIRIISRAGQDVGYVAVGRSAREIRLFNIMILPAYQNRRIGTAVIQNLQAEARARQVPLNLQVLKVNPARRLYERLGLVVTGETPTHYQMRWTA